MDVRAQETSDAHRSTARRYGLEESFPKRGFLDASLLYECPHGPGRNWTRPKQMFNIARWLCHRCLEELRRIRRQVFDVDRAIDGRLWRSLRRQAQNSVFVIR